MTLWLNASFLFSSVFLQSVQRQCFNVVFLHNLAQFAGVAGCIAYYKGFVFHAIVQSCENRIKLRRLVRIETPSACQDCTRKPTISTSADRLRGWSGEVSFVSSYYSVSFIVNPRQLVFPSCSTRRAELSNSEL